MEMRHDSPQPVKAPHFQTSISAADLQRLILMANDDNIDYRVLARAMEPHSAVLLMLHRTANSVSYGIARQPDSIQHALAILGLDRVRALLHSLRDTLSPDHSRVA